jgi:hypothetical protein
MGMSFNMHLCDENSFEKIKENILNKFEVNVDEYAIKSYFLEKLYNGLEYLLLKIFPKDIVKIIFNGSETICSIDFKSNFYKNLSEDERINLYINTPQVSYISHEQVNNIYKYFVNENGDKIYESFNADELNKNKVYSENWTEKYKINYGNYSSEHLYADFFKDEYLKIKELFEYSINNNLCIFIEIM